ncbi:putative leader peptide [Actinospica acidithermotolerans]
MDRVVRPVASLSRHLVARRHVDFARVSSALCR